MTEKKFCDGCGKDITDVEDVYSFTLYSDKYEGNDFEQDLCRKCKSRAKKVETKTPA